MNIIYRAAIKAGLPWCHDAREVLVPDTPFTQVSERSRLSAVTVGSGGQIILGPGGVHTAAVQHC